MFPKITNEHPHIKYNHCPKNLRKLLDLSSGNKNNLTTPVESIIMEDSIGSAVKDKQNRSINKAKRNQYKGPKLRSNNSWINDHQKIRCIQNQCRKVPKQKNQFVDGKFCDIIDMNDYEESMHPHKNNQPFENDLFRPQQLQNKVSFNLPQNESSGTISVKKIVTAFKPPHRYKSCMAIFKSNLLLYAGLGCEKDLAWAKLAYDGMKWEIYKEASQGNYVYKPLTPLYGHTMVAYKDRAVIFGGTSTAQINETTIIKNNTMEIQAGQRGPNRRKFHSAIMYGDYMIVHGGIQARETKSDFMVYHIPQNKWSLVSCSNAPTLSCHKMASTHDRKKNKQVFMFGGKSEKQKVQKKLYAIRMLSEKEIKCERIQTLNTPPARHSFCFQGISTNQLLLYGGKQNTETTQPWNHINQGVFNDIHLYSTQSRTWTLIQTKMKMQYCFGMASSSINGKVFIFGGSNPQSYCDASLYIIGLGGNSAETGSNLLEIDKNGFESEGRIRYSNRALLSKQYFE